MDDPLSSLGLTAVTLYQVHSTAVDVLIKRPYKNTLTYQRISFASYKRLERLAHSGSNEIVQVPNTSHEAYFLFYWQKRFSISTRYQCLTDLNRNDPTDQYPG